MNTTKVAQTKNSTIKVDLDRDVVDKIANLDGHKVNLGREIIESLSVKITLKATGQSVRISGKVGYLPALNVYSDTARDKLDLPAKAYARIGDASISNEAYEIIQDLIAQADADLPKTDEHIAIETEIADKKAAAKASAARLEKKLEERNNHPGWCNRCTSYCYGDCTA